MRGTERERGRKEGAAEGGSEKPGESMLIKSEALLIAFVFGLAFET